MILKSSCTQALFPELPQDITVEVVVGPMEEDMDLVVGTHMEGWAAGVMGAWAADVMGAWVAGLVVVMAVDLMTKVTTAKTTMTKRVTGALPTLREVISTTLQILSAIGAITVMDMVDEAMVDQAMEDEAMVDGIRERDF